MLSTRVVRLTASRARRGTRATRGQTTVEFAFVAIAFFALLLGVVDGCWYLFGRSSIVTAAREGARQGIVSSPSFCDPTTVANAARKNAGPFSNFPAPTVTSGTDSAGLYCQVTVRYPYSPFAGISAFGATTISSTSKEYKN